MSEEDEWGLFGTKPTCTPVYEVHALPCVMDLRAMMACG